MKSYIKAIIIFNENDEKRLVPLRHCKAKMKRKDPKISEKLYATRKSSRLRDFESTRPAH